MGYNNVRETSVKGVERKVSLSRTILLALSYLDVA